MENAETGHVFPFNGKCCQTYMLIVKMLALAKYSEISVKVKNKSHNVD